MTPLQTLLIEQSELREKTSTDVLGIARRASAPTNRSATLTQSRRPRGLKAMEPDLRAAVIAAHDADKVTRLRQASLPGTPKEQSCVS